MAVFATVVTIFWVLNLYQDRSQGAWTSRHVHSRLARKLACTEMNPCSTYAGMACRCHHLTNTNCNPRPITKTPAPIRLNDVKRLRWLARRPWPFSDGRRWRPRAVLSGGASSSAGSNSSSADMAGSGQVAITGFSSSSRATAPDAARRSAAAAITPARELHGASGSTAGQLLKSDINTDTAQQTSANFSPDPPIVAKHQLAGRPVRHTRGRVRQDRTSCPTVRRSGWARVLRLPSVLPRLQEAAARPDGRMTSVRRPDGRRPRG